MAQKTLTIEQQSNVVNGFKKEPMNITGIPEGANVDGNLLHKLGTSIPTPFARLHLFDSAFKEVVDNQITDSDNNYFKLVSLALDMLEFLYLNGDSSNLAVEKWDVDKQVDALKNSGNRKLEKFGEAIESAWRNGGYTGNGIYMFKYGSDYIGGTSPLSLVFTNPNLRTTFPGLSNDHLLFDSSTAIGLIDRDEEFRVYLYKLYLSNTGVFGTNMRQYITDTMSIDTQENKEIKEDINRFTSLSPADMVREMTHPTDGSQSLTTMKDGKIDLSISLQNGQLTMLVKDLKHVSFKTSYRLKPTCDHYKTYTRDGATYTMATPLALNDQGIGASYVNTSRWISGSLPLSDRNVPVPDRKLPRTEIMHPYVMASDFLADKLVQVGYNIQKGKFHTGLKQNTSFLVPLKREFFKYFKPEDIEGMLTVDEQKDHLGRVTNVHVTLMLPLEGNRQIPFEKDYSEENGDIVRAFEGTDSFNLGIFPFFVETNAPDHHYKVMAVHTTSDLRLAFLDSAKPSEAFQLKDNAGVGEYEVDERTQKNEHETYSSKHYDITKVFDVIEVEVTASGRTGTGIVLPAMRRIDSQNPGRSFTFGVDFGTTNTQIAYSSSAGNDIRTFSIGMNGGAGDEVQMVYLNDHDVKDGKHLTDYGFGLFEVMKDAAAREFLTPELKESDFPMRTAICEVDNLAHVTPRMFGALNIGFNYSKELTEGIGKNRYKTELKWDYTDNRAHDRIEVFFEELLWLMRNKSLLNNGGRDINVVVTYPQAMSGMVERDFKDAWYAAADNIGLRRDHINFQLESIAPYYSFSRRQGLADVYLNMDIGGGSTDILYHDPVTGGEKLTLSVLFAANDIWGDGCSPLLVGGNNGYIRTYEKSAYYAALSDLQKDNYRKVKENSHKSSDIINYLFKNDKDYKFTRAVKGSKLALLPIMHFSALVYYMAHLVESFELKPVCTLTFTGMGSTYLRMLGDESQLAQLANAIVDSANEHPRDNSSNLDIIFADEPKKVTAEGAVIISNATALQVDILKPERGLCYGVEDEIGGETRVTTADIRDNTQKEKVLAVYDRIADMLVNDDRVRGILSNMGLDEAVNAIPSAAELKKIFSNSFGAYQQIYTRKHKADADKTKVAESLFFWPLKDGLFQLGIEISK